MIILSVFFLLHQNKQNFFDPTTQQKNEREEKVQGEKDKNCLFL